MQTSESLRVEESCISWAMAEPKATLEHGIEADWFGDPRCRKAWEALQEVAREGGGDEPLMHYVLAERMRPGADHELVLSWLTQRLMAAVLDRPNWRFWTQRLRFNAAERIRTQAAGVLADRLKATDEEEKRDAAVTEFMAAMSTLPSIETDEPQTLYDVLKGALSSLEQRVKARERGEQANLGIPTGIEWLDSKLGGGYPRGCVTVLAGRTSHGKSTVAQISALNALRRGYGVHFFCLEDGAEVFGARVMAQAADLTVGRFFAGDCPEIGRVASAIDGESSNGAMRRFLFDTKRMPLEQLIARVDRYRASNNTAIVFIDYLGLIPLPGDAERHQEVEMAVTRLQEAAIEQGVAYVVLHQLNRTFAGRQNKQPMLSDLRDSGAIEERAAVVVFAHRPNVDDGADQNAGADPVDDMHLVLAKNKFGPRNALAALRVDFSRYRIVR